MKTYKVTFPLTVTVEIEAAEGPAMADYIRFILSSNFNRIVAIDPLAETVVALNHGYPFSVSDRATIKTAILVDGETIEVESL